LPAVRASAGAAEVWWAITDEMAKRWRQVRGADLGHWGDADAS